MHVALVHVCWLSSIIFLVVDLSNGQAPPPQPPPEIVSNLTLGGKVPLEYYYVDDSNKGQGTHYKYSSDDIADMMSQASKLIEKALSISLPPPPPTLPPSSTWLSQLSDIWLIHALHKYSVQGKDVVVFGSTSPWYESIVLQLGASKVTVVEYNQLTYDHPAITTMLLGDLALEKQFDIALSLSSFDHDGLGRYGDRLHPDGDLLAMRTVAAVLKDQGLLFLTVPIGPDVVVWNLHRRYGNMRLPLLLEGWERVEDVGWDERLLTKEAPYTKTYEPVFVLRPEQN